MMALRNRILTIASRTGYASRFSVSSPIAIVRTVAVRATPNALALDMLPVKQCYMFACVHGDQIS